MTVVFTKGEETQIYRGESHMKMQTNKEMAM